MMQRNRNSTALPIFLKISPPCDPHTVGTLSRACLFPLVEVTGESSRNKNKGGTTMRRNVKTILMGTVALMAGVGLASAQGMRDAPGGAGGAPSSQATPDSSGSHRDMKGTPQRGQKNETRGQAQGERQ